MTRLALILAALAAAPVAAQEIEGASCEALGRAALPSADVTLARPVPAAEGLPAYCQVQGTIWPETRFELRLPTTWNRKFYMAGCGGFCGQVPADSPDLFNAINHAVVRGYAAAAMNGGHWGSGSTDARWALADPVAEADWAYRAVEETTAAAKTLTETYYAEAPRLSYFQGCSTGGRMANMAALREPEAFDGIISGAPALDYPGLVGTSFAWIAQANTGDNGRQILAPGDAGTVAGAAIAACDGADGVEDGMISDPLSCDFDPGSLDLSPEKIEVLRKWYVEPADGRGEVLYPAAVPVGSEPYWPLWLTDLADGGGALVPNAFGPNFLSYMAFPEDPAPGFGPLDFDFDSDPARMAPLGALYNSDDPDLSAFRDAGGKLLMYHGWADAIVFPGKTLDYFGMMTDATGADFARLFMIPGMDHCGIQGTGPGIDQTGFDPLSALEAWAEEGEAPDRLPTTKRIEGEEQWSRPVCAWPAKAVFAGEGDWRSAEGWRCE